MQNRKLVIFIRSKVNIVNLCVCGRGGGRGVRKINACILKADVHAKNEIENQWLYIIGMGCYWQYEATNACFCI